MKSSWFFQPNVGCVEIGKIIMMIFIRTAVLMIERVPDGELHREVGETCFRSLAGQNALSAL